MKKIALGLDRCMLRTRQEVWLWEDGASRPRVGAKSKNAI